MPHRYSWSALKRTRSAALIAALTCCWPTAQAQLVFVPDTNFRAWLDYLVPGSVDANGYIDTTDPVVTATHALVLNQATMQAALNGPGLPGIDLTGIEGFTQLERLEIDLGYVSAMTVPAWPASLHHLQVYTLQAFTLPAWPGTLDYLSLEFLAGGPPCPAFPAGLDSLILRNTPELPTLPSSLTYLAASAELDISIPPLPAGLTHLDLQHFTLPSGTVLPAGLVELYLDQCSVPDGLTDLPPQLERFHWYPGVVASLSLSSWPVPLTEIAVEAYQDHLAVLPAAWPTGLHKLYLADGSGLMQQLPALPGGLTDLVLVSMVGLTAVPALPVGSSTLTLQDLPALQAVPALPAGLSTLYLKDLLALQALPALPGSLTSLSLINVPLVPAIPELPASLTTLRIDQLPQVNCLPLLPDGLSSLDVDGFVPPFDSLYTPIGCMPNLPAGLTSPFMWHGNLALPDDPSLLCTVLNSTCPFLNPVLSGTVFWDQNANGTREVGEPGYAVAEVQVQPGNYTIGVVADGGFMLPLPQGTYTLTASGTSPYITSIMPSAQSAVLNSPTMVETGNDFGVVLQPNVQDLRIDAYASPARPGFDNFGTLSYANAGTIPMNGTVSFTFDADQSWVSSTPPPTSLTGNTATWDFGALQLGETRTIQFDLHTDASVALGTALTHTAVIDPLLTDHTAADNTTEIEATVVGSYDPNEKEVSPASLPPSAVESGARLTYTVHFQNTGTYPAERVIITDTLDAALDPASFELLSSGHPCTWVMLDHGILRISFIPIALPDSASDERGSQGFVRFAVRTLPGLLDGTTIPNVANIYFDYNAPVVTTPAVFSVDASTGVAEEGAMRMEVWPNPATGAVTISAPEAPANTPVQVFDATGRVVQHGVLYGGRAVLDLSRLAAGTYQVQVRGVQGAWVRTVVKY